ncbi:MAG: hypothetical protein ABH839_03335 [Chloroflexota bacterium]
MADEIKVGDRVRVKDRPWWPGGYRMKDAEGDVVELKKPWGYVVTYLRKAGPRAEEIGVSLGATITFRDDEVEKIS